MFIRILRILLLVLTIGIFFRMTGSAYTLWQRRYIVNDRTSEAAGVEAENTRLKRELEDIQSSDFLEREARNTLGLVKPGEVQVIITSQGPTASGAGNREKIGFGKLKPGWQTWWGLFF